MKPNPQADEVLYQAMQLDRSLRYRYVHARCRDGGYAEEILELLRAHDEAGLFLEWSPMVRMRAGDRDMSFAGQTIGAYRLLRRVGQGGSSRVYLGARVDGRFDQRVAIKILPNARELSAAFDAFRNECRILAHLDHPNVVRIIGSALSDEGFPFIVLEYVDGSPIDEFCEETSLGLRGRLELFGELCRVVSYTHGRLTIHRDLKPANVLVSRVGRVKLVDFGSALSVNAVSHLTEATPAPLHPLTPAYASPEQLRGDMASASSDVYSMGVLLYELLTGRLPLEPGDASLIETLGRTIAEDPPLPSLVALDRAPYGGWRDGLRGTLDAILLKALSSNPKHRFATAAEFEEAIRDHLEGGGV